MEEIFVPLDFCKKLWTVLGVCRASKSNALGIFFNFVIIANNLILGLISLKLLVFESNSTPVTALSFALLQLISAIACGGSYALVAKNKTQTTDIIYDISLTVQARCNEFNEIHYKNADKFSTFVTRWFAPLNICLFTVSLILLTIGFLVTDLIKGEIDVSKWYNLLQVR